MNNTLLIFDVDDLTLNYFYNFKKWVTEQGYELHSEYPEVWDLNCWIKMHCGRNANELIHEFNSSEAFCNLEPVKDADVFMPLLLDAGYKIAFLTACGTSERIRFLRKENLKKCFGDSLYEQSMIKFVEVGESKNDSLIYFRDNCVYDKIYFFEDHIANANLGHELGLKTVLLENSRNKNTPTHDGIYRARSWAELYDYVVSGR